MKLFQDVKSLKKANYLMGSYVVDDALTADSQAMAQARLKRLKTGAPKVYAARVLEASNAAKYSGHPLSVEIDHTFGYCIFFPLQYD